jgi:glucose/arabinose dehydrogenase
MKTIILIFLMISANAFAQVATGFQDVQHSNNWVSPTSFVFDSQGRMFVAEKAGKVWVYDNGLVATPLLDISEEVGNYLDYGLLSIILDPEFVENGYFYVFYAVDRLHLMSYGTPNYNAAANEYNQATIARLTRYKADVATNFHTLVPDSRLILLGNSVSDGIPLTSDVHAGGGMAFGKDGSLMVAAGGGQGGFTVEPQAVSSGILTSAQAIGHYRTQIEDCTNGKILRIDPATGNGLASNPLYNASTPRSAASRTWGKGLRNPFKMVYKPNTGSHQMTDANPGVFYVADVGDGNREEVNLVNTHSLNFGWPKYEGIDYLPGYNNVTYLPTIHTPPVIEWGHSTTNTARTSVDGVAYNIGSPQFLGDNFSGSCTIMGDWITSTTFPTQFQNSLLIADYTKGWIKTVTFNASNNPIAIQTLHSSAWSATSLAYNPVDGSVYYVSYPDQIRKIYYAPTGNLSPKAVATALPIYGPSPLTVNFAGSQSSDPENSVLTYQWDFKDNTANSTVINPAHTFIAPISSPTKYLVKLKVTDAAGQSDTTNVIVSVNNTPPVIDSTSIDTLNYYPNNVAYPLSLSAKVTDNEHNLAQLSFQWQVTLHHDVHTHADDPIVSNVATTILSVLPCDEHEYYYAIKLTVTDAAGLSTSKTKIVRPHCGTTPVITTPVVTTPVTTTPTTPTTPVVTTPVTPTPTTPVVTTPVTPTPTTPVVATPTSPVTTTPTTPVVTTPTSPVTPTASGCVVNKVRLKFRADCCSERLIGAKIQGSNDGTTWATIHSILVGGTGVWQDIEISNTTGYQQVRFVAGSSGYGELIELEFYNNTTKLTGTPFGSTGNSGSLDGALKALDGSEGTFWHGNVTTPGASNYAGLILTGCSSVTTPTTPVTTTPTTPTTPVVTTPTSPVTTTPTTPVTTTPVTTTPTASGCVVNKVRLKFRADCCSERLIGAKIQGSNDGTTWATIHSILVGGTGAWQDIEISNTTGYQQARFVAGPSGYGELIELEFYNNTTKLTGTPFGSTGNSGSLDGALKALDGSEGTFWHGNVATPGTSNYAGLILTGCSSVTTPTTPVTTTPTTPVVTTPTSPVTTTPTTPVTTTPVTTTPTASGCVVNKVRLKFRADCCSERLIGAKIQGSNDGTTWATIHSILVGGTGAWQDIEISNTTGYQQARFVAGSSGYGELIELEFYNNNTKLTGTPFGSTGNSGSLDGALKALDGREGTFWHGNVATPGTSNYAGLILTGCSVTNIRLGVAESQNVEQIDDINHLELSPNPTSSYLRYQLMISEKSGATITILDLTGRTVLTNTIENQSTVFDGLIDVSHLPAGLYLFQFQTSNRLFTKKIVVQK